MNFLSAKQTAALWGISQRRVTLLATQGRIPGAVYMGKTWLIPEDARKPADSRKKNAPSQPEHKEADIYPYLICIVNSENQVNSFSDEERKLYCAILSSESGDFPSARREAEALLGTKDRSIRLGALYSLVWACMYMKDYESASMYSVLFQTEYHSAEDNSQGLKLLHAAFLSETGRSSEFLGELDRLDFTTISAGLLPYAATARLFGQMLRFLMDGVLPDLAAYEAICRFAEAGGYFYAALQIHSSLSALYGFTGNTEEEFRHLKCAADIAVRHNTLFPLAYFVSVGSGTTEAVLNELRPETADKIIHLARVVTGARDGFTEYQSRHSSLSMLSREDYKLILCCQRNYTVAEMAREFGLSRSGMNRRLANLYSKMGVDSKKELIHVYTRSLLDWGTDANAGGKYLLN